MQVRIQVQAEAFDPGQEYTQLMQRNDLTVGGVASFVGLVRNTYGDQSGGLTGGLELEHYPGMTEQSIDKIIQQAADRWPLFDVVVIHRIGRLLAGDNIVFVQVAAGHRDAAFAGCEFIMDYLKTDAVFWKKEVADQDAQWVKSTLADRARSQSWKQGKS